MWHCFVPPIEFRGLTITERGLFAEMLRIGGTMGTIPYTLGTDPFDAVFRLCAGHESERLSMRIAFHGLCSAELFSVDPSSVNVSESVACGCEYSER
jgi:hypothetical protein